jgi:hypothetical protein
MLLNVPTTIQRFFFSLEFIKSLTCYQKKREKKHTHTLLPFKMGLEQQTIYGVCIFWGNSTVFMWVSYF